MSLSRALVIVVLASALAWLGLFFYRFQSQRAILPVRGQFITVDGRRLYFQDQGSGRPVLLLHGFPYHSESYQPLLNRGDDSHRFLALDFPGLGLSEKYASAPADPESLSLLVKAFADRLELRSVDVVGHDLGGGVGIMLASRFPQLVRRLVLIAPDSSSGQAGEATGWWWRTPGIRETWALVRLHRDYIRDVLAQAWPSPEELWREAVEKYSWPLDMAGGRSGFLRLERGRYPAAYEPFEERLRTPTLILWGEQDRVVSPEAGQVLVRKLANARLVTLPAVGHLPLEEAPDETADRVLAFLDQ